MEETKQSIRCFDANTAVPVISLMIHNLIKSNRPQRQIYATPSKELAMMSVYKIGLSFGNNDDEDDDVPDLVHTVSCYDTDLCKEMIHTMLHNFRYREMKTAQTEFFMCPIKTIVRIVNHIAQVVNDTTDMAKEATNRLYIVDA